MGSAAVPAGNDPVDSHEYLKAQVLACLRRTRMNANDGAAKTRMVQEAAFQVEHRAETGRFRVLDGGEVIKPSGPSAVEESKVKAKVASDLKRIEGDR